MNSVLQTSSSAQVPGAGAVGLGKAMKETIVFTLLTDVIIRTREVLWHLNLPLKTPLLFLEDLVLSDWTGLTRL